MYYRVNVCRVTNNDKNKLINALRRIDYIIVQKTPFGIKEIMTGQKIYAWNNDILGRYVSNKSMIRYGFQFVISKEELNNGSTVTSEQLEEYTDSFEYSNFKLYYDEMKEKDISLNKKRQQEKEDRKKVKNKIRQIKTAYVK